MRTQVKLEAVARPITLEGPGYPPALIKVIVESAHPSGHGRVHLTVDQALYLHSRLTQIAVLFIHGDPAGAKHSVFPDLAFRDEDPDVRLGPYWAEAWPVGSEGAGFPPVLEMVLIESIHPDGHGVVRLSPEQALYIRDRLEQISFTFLHENVWGGEDARRQ